MYILKLIIFFSILLSSCATKQSSLDQLTLVDDPFSYENSYFPLSVGNYWKMGHYEEIKSGKLSLVGYFLINVLDYEFQELYLENELKYLPVYRIEKLYTTMDSTTTTKTYQYSIKTNEGIIISEIEPKDNLFEPYLFISSNKLYDELSYKLTNKPIERGVKIKTPFFELTCMRIEIIEENIGGSILFAKDKGHVASLLYDNYPQNTTRMDNQIVLVEYKVE